MQRYLAKSIKNVTRRKNSYPPHANMQLSLSTLEISESELSCTNPRYKIANVCANAFKNSSSVNNYFIYFIIAKVHILFEG